MKRMLRKQNYVDSSVQGALLRRIFVHWLVFFLVTTISILVLKTLLGDPSVPMVERLKFEMGEFVFMSMIILSLFPAFMLDTIRFSNRFVGPIVRLRRSLRELIENRETDQVKFRDNDFWLEMGDEFNKVNDIIKSQQEEIESLKAKLETTRSA